MPAPKILFVQHANLLGGSTYSLLLLMKGLVQQGYQPEVALVRPTPSVRTLYVDNGFQVHEAPKIEIFAHTTGSWAHLKSRASLRQLIRTIYGWRKGQRATLQLVTKINPDIVHLNSVVLSPSAIALQKADIPFVWHVRECPPFQDVRTKFIRKKLLASPQVIFLSTYDQQQWIGGFHGEILPNCVDFASINSAPTKAEARKLLGLPAKRPIVLYLGGPVSIKGFHVLLQAAIDVLKKQPETLFLMPGSEVRLASGGFKSVMERILPHFGLGTGAQRVLKFIDQNNLGNAIELLPFSTNVTTFLSACDLLVFPSIMPHFARPVIEALAMGRPVVGSNIGGVRELIESEKTGILTTPGCSTELANAILELLDDTAKAIEMGIIGRDVAVNKYNSEQYIKKITTIYKTMEN